MNVHELLEFSLLALGSLFVIVDPIAAVPLFLAMTPHDTPAQRIRTARLACVVMAGVLLLFAVAGRTIFKFFGITMPAFQIAASIVLLMVALDMLRAQRSRVRETEEETTAGAAKEDIAITPLAVPMLAGPGAISTVILLHNRAEGVAGQVILYASILVVALASYLIFRLSARGAQWLNPIALRVTSRVMGLLLAAVAVQFLINGVNEVRADWVSRD
ncbi:MAG: MarC family protein [Verrucomicrobiae bacterium]|nr:MarC family protein [Verrucomicrobiae bacterium]MDW8309462.1 MarC family protein [Verrucomicrobiales bacterium]